MLEIQALSVHYGGIQALDGVSLTVEPGEILTILGANGAGKSSLMHAIVGLVEIESGTVTFKGNSIVGVPPQELARLGISLVPEGREIFPLMSCRDNLRMGLFASRALGAFEQRARTVFDLFPRLEERLDQRAGTLSGGEQQMLAIGRALMQDPELLLLDEPSLGLSPALTQDLFARIEQIRDQGKTIVLVEQRARMALGIANRGYVLSVGRIMQSGSAQDLRDDETIRRVYFGE